MRKKVAIAELNELKREQKDVGKLKSANEQLKHEMASLRAMLAAQAKEDASRTQNSKELDAKQQEILILEKRVTELEKQLQSEKALVSKLEEELQLQKQSFKELELLRQQVPPPPASQRRVSHAPSSPKPHQRNLSENDAIVANGLIALPGNYVSPEIVAEHQARVALLEEELEAERKLRREADGEIIKLRAAINGVQLNDSEVDALLAQTLETAPASNKAQAYDEQSEDQSEYSYADNDVGDQRYVDSSSTSIFLLELPWHHDPNRFVLVFCSEPPNSSKQFLSEFLLCWDSHLRFTSFLFGCLPIGRRSRNGSLMWHLI